MKFLSTTCLMVCLVSANAGKFVHTKMTGDAKCAGDKVLGQGLTSQDCQKKYADNGNGPYAKITCDETHMTTHHFDPKDKACSGTVAKTVKEDLCNAKNGGLSVCDKVMDAIIVHAFSDDKCTKGAYESFYGKDHCTMSGAAASKKVVCESGKIQEHHYVTADCTGSSTKFYGAASNATHDMEFYGLTSSACMKKDYPKQGYSEYYKAGAGCAAVSGGTKAGSGGTTAGSSGTKAASNGTKAAGNVTKTASTSGATKFGGPIGHSILVLFLIYCVYH